MTNALPEDLLVASSTSESFASYPEETTGLLLQRSDAISGSTVGTPTSLVTTSSTSIESARRLLYISHFFNQFSECTWQFCLVLFLAAFSNYQSLILVTSYGLVSYSFVCFFGSSAGRFIDGTNRLQVARQFIGFENCAVLLATVLCYWLLSKDQQGKSIDSKASALVQEQSSDMEGILTDPISIVLLIGIHLLGAIAALLDSGFTVAVERDWIVVMSVCAAAAAASSSRISTTTSSSEEEQTAQKIWLSNTNVTMRQIDLSCKIVAPAIAGFVIAFFDDGSGRDHGYDLRGAAVLVGGWNALALVVEWVCTYKIYHDIPELAVKSGKSNEKDEDRLLHETNGHRNQKSGLVHQGIQGRWLLLKAPDGLSVYFDQPICWAGFSLALLYLNVVLTFGGIMTAYLVWRGMSMEAIGMWRGVSSAAGLAGTFVYHFMSKTTGLISIGMISVVFQFLCLTLCYVSLYIQHRTVSFVMLIAGVCLSRIGLWVFDISVTQLMQEHIPAPIRGLVGGVQQSLNALFTLLAYAIGLFISDPKDFYIYCSIAYVGVALAALVFARNVFTNRNSLFSSNELDS
jgi:solute carrier family 40 (iron-regulated transporter), member 1